MKKYLFFAILPALFILLSTRQGFAQSSFEDQRRLQQSDSLYQMNSARAAEAQKMMKIAQDQFKSAQREYSAAKKAYQEANKAANDAKKAYNMEKKLQKSKAKALKSTNAMDR